MSRKISIAWIVLSVLMIVVAYSGIGSDWLQSAASCGADGEAARKCNPGEVQHVLALTGWISLAVSVLELTVLPRMTRGLSF